MCASGGMSPEIAARTRQHSQGLGALSSILREPRLVQTVKRVYSEAICGAALLHNAHTWAALTPAHTAQLDTAILRRARRTARLPEWTEDRRTSGAAAVGAARPATATEAIRAQRLRYLPRLIQWAPPVLLRLLDHN